MEIRRGRGKMLPRRFGVGGVLQSAEKAGKVIPLRRGGRGRGRGNQSTAAGSLYRGIGERGKVMYLVQRECRQGKSRRRLRRVLSLLRSW